MKIWTFEIYLDTDKPIFPNFILKYKILTNNLIHFDADENTSKNKT